MEMVARDVQESENNKSCIICDRMFIETEIFDKYYFISIFIFFGIYADICKTLKNHNVYNF